jgi:ligand-binding sensor domain-containing protein/DNA-binding CsgD family transcriptional regulator
MLAISFTERACTKILFALLGGSIIALALSAEALGQPDQNQAVTIMLKDRPAPKVIFPSITEVRAKSSIRNLSIYGIKDGLALQSVVSGCKDNDGNLWFGTAGGGVSKFDGTTFTNYDERHGVGNGVVRAVTQDAAGNYYFGTRTGLSVYNGEYIKNYYVDDGLPAKPIVALLTDKQGNIWCGTMGGGLIRFDGKTFKTFTTIDGLPSNTIRSIEVDKNGLLWIGTAQGVATFNGTTFQIFQTPDFSDKTIYDIHFDTKGSLWFASANGVLRFFNQRLEHFSRKNGISDLNVLSIGESGDGVIWFGTLDGGVTRFDGTTFEAITTENGLPSNRVWAIVTDANGSTWFCTQGGGVARYNGDALVGFTTHQGLAHNLVWAIAQDRKGTLWFAHDIGIGSFDGRVFRNIVSKDTLFHFFAIAADSLGTIWGGGRQGLICWNGKTITKYSTAQGIASNQITDIVVDKSNVVWVGTEEGVSRFDGKSFTNYVLDARAQDRRVSRMFIDRSQTVWAATFNGVFRHNGSGFEPALRDGLPENFGVTAFAQDENGFYWLGSRRGLVRFDGKQSRHFTYEDDLPNDHIFDMKLDPATADLWMGTNLGLIKLAFRSPDNELIAAGKLGVANDAIKNYKLLWSEYNRHTDYPLDDLNHPALFITGKQSATSAIGPSIIWAGFADKLFRFDPQSQGAHVNTNHVSINHLKLQERLVPWTAFMAADDIANSALTNHEKLILGKSLSNEAREQLSKEFKGVIVKGIQKFSQLPIGLVLPHDIDQIRFEFGVAQTSQTRPLTYQYRLVGYQNEWSYPSGLRSATFTNLWEGSYTFEVRTQSIDGSWTKPATFGFSVSPPWWRTWPMYIAYSLIFALLIFLFIKIRERSLLEEKQTLEKIISKRTNEVMEQMHAAELQKAEAQKQKLEAERQRALVEEKNAEIARQLADTEASLSNLTLQMIQRFHLYSELEQELKKLAEMSDSKKYQKVFSLITMNKSLEKEWEQFNFYFNGLYKDFNDKLRRISQQLSNYDLRMCALIKMGLENREIAMLLNIEVSSVKMAKYRLKKKFNIDESVSLRTYFETL